MVDLLLFLNKHGMAINLLGSVVIGISILYLQTKFAPKTLIDNFEQNKDIVQNQLHEFDKRILNVEQGLKDLPTVKEFHDLKLHMCNLGGELKRVDETIEGLESLLQRAEKQLTLIDQYIRSSK
ncbi:MAG: hypothetical protein CBB87_08140 [Micavibrio sp. TMED27]|nr:hypothetical protein [Micavibrio sp.]OUT90640.1 MAG: hypothetical protein CBB87_08140 [Micavibrio sp. TMED27]|tara:strand:+ start:624 stop:995 length:372 start_codon:yes stop_codon:yes gene_type:complete